MAPSASDSSSSSEEEDLSIFASCAVSADQIEKNAEADAKKRVLKASQRPIASAARAAAASRTPAQQAGDGEAAAAPGSSTGLDLISEKVRHEHHCPYLHLAAVNDAATTHNMRAADTLYPLHTCRSQRLWTQSWQGSLTTGQLLVLLLLPAHLQSAASSRQQQQTAPSRVVCQQQRLLPQLELSAMMMMAQVCSCSVQWQKAHHV
jgi:hypothetical protein